MPRTRTAPVTDATVTDPPVAKKPKAPKWDVMDTDRAVWVAQHARPAVALCLCGCGGTTKGRFAPGHDATLKAQLAVTATTGTGKAKTNAEAALVTFGW